MYRRIVLWMPVFCAIMAWNWFPLAVWADLSQGLIAFLGLLCAALVQVIPITANFLQADHLYPEEAVRLSQALERQQRFWLGLLAAAIIAFVLVLISSAVPSTASLTVPLKWTTEPVSISVARIMSAMLAFTVSFVVLNIGAVIFGVLSLQKLRTQLVIMAAKRRVAAEVAQQMQHATVATTTVDRVVPDDYGSIVRPH
jgi:hypothetical protein